MKTESKHIKQEVKDSLNSQPLTDELLRQMKPLKKSKIVDFMKMSEYSFTEWDNEEDEIYDSL